jgi:two-component system, OmpR family, response regulator ResD
VSPSSEGARLAAARADYEAARARLAEVCFIAEGSCRCTDPKGLHSHYRLSWKEAGTTVSRRPSAEEAHIYREWIDNRRTLESVLAEKRVISADAAADVLSAAGHSFQGRARPRGRQRARRSGRWRHSNQGYPAPTAISRGIASLPERCQPTETPVEWAALVRREMATPYHLRNFLRPTVGGRLPSVVVSGSHVLVVDDDPTVVDVMARYLDREGFEVTTLGDGPAAVDAARRRLPDLVVLDLMLPGMEGLEVFRRLRLLGPVPVIMLTALGEEEDRLVGLDLGADDYVTKPFSPREVTARVKAVLNRARTPSHPVLGRGPVVEAGDLAVDIGAREVRLAGAPVVLTPRELDLLVFLMRHPRVVFRREELMEAVWGWACGDTATITVHIRRLREKIEADPSRPSRIATVWGAGYRFDG